MTSTEGMASISKPDKQVPTEADLDQQDSNKDKLRLIRSRLRIVTGHRDEAVARVDRWNERFDADAAGDSDDR